MRHMFLRSARVLTLIAFGVSLTSCGTFTNPDINMGPRLGFRPDDPSFTMTPADPCKALTEYIQYAVNLKEAYRTRATQNRTWIYVAAITGLGVAAASGALAAATAVAAGTLALLAISGGFTAAAFATIDNSELANVYTVAANDIGTALGNAEGRVARCPFPEECKAELAYLIGAVTTARNMLETARTSSAAGALARATAQKKLLDEEIAKVQAQAEAQAKAKDAADKREAANKAKIEADAAQKEAAEAKDKAKTAEQARAPDAKNKADAAKIAEDKATEADKTAKAKDKEAKEAEAKKAQIDAAARAAASAPVDPPCLALLGKIPARIVGIKKQGDKFTGPANTTVNGEKPADDKTPPSPPLNRTAKVEKPADKTPPSPLDLLVENVNLRNVPNDLLFVEVGGVKAPVVDKTSPDLNQPYMWVVRFVPPAEKPKDATSTYAPKLLYGTETLADESDITITYD